jgi:hypothetical protein
VKIAIRNPENSPIVIVITKWKVSWDTATLTVIEAPLSPAGASAGTPGTPQVKRPDTPKATAIINSIDSGAAPIQPTLDGARISAGGTVEFEPGTVLPPNSSQLFSTLVPVGVGNCQLTLEWYEIPLLKST